MSFNLENLKAAVMMVVVQIAYAGATIMYKLATNDGMGMRILVAYRYLFATAFMAPLAFFLERESRPKLTWMVVFQSFLCGLFGCTLGQNLFLASLKFTTTTIATTMGNLVPAFTFILAVALGLEKMAIGSLNGRAKVLGTLLGVGGAMLLTFYRGVEINIWSSHLIHLPNSQGSHGAKSHSAAAGTRVLGALLAIIGCMSNAVRLIIQAKLAQIYPCHYSSTTLICMMASIQAVVFALCMDRERAQWKLALDIRLLSVCYTGIIASGVILTITTWCIQKKGPVFVSNFNPLMLVVVAIAGSIMLDERLHLGSVLGAAMIACGLYVVMWGKSMEIRASKNSTISTEAVEVVVLSPNTNNTSVSPCGMDHHTPETEDPHLNSEESRSKKGDERIVSPH